MRGKSLGRSFGRPIDAFDIGEVKPVSLRPSGDAMPLRRRGAGAEQEQEPRLLRLLQHLPFRQPAAAADGGQLGVGMEARGGDAGGEGKNACEDEHEGDGRAARQRLKNSKERADGLKDR